MDFERIALLLEVFHASLDVPNTAHIRAEVLRELAEHNAGNYPVVEELKPQPEPQGRLL